MSATLEDALQNALLFAGDARTASGGLIKIEYLQGQIVVEAYDDFTYVKTTVDEPAAFEAGADYLLAKEVRVALREGPEAVAKVDRHPDPGCFGDAAEMVNEAAASMAGFWIAPDRWKKLGSLKPAGLPMKITTHYDNGFSYASFRYGSSVGLLSFLDADVLREEGLI